MEIDGKYFMFISWPFLNDDRTLKAWTFFYDKKKLWGMQIKSLFL